MIAKMSDKHDKAATADTVPPPASGDAYSALTVQRLVPAELLAEAKQDLMRRAPRARKKPVAAAVQARLEPAPLPHIERLFADEDSASDDDETVMRPMPPSSRSTGALVGGLAPGIGAHATGPDEEEAAEVRESPRVAEVVRDSATSEFPSRRSSASSASLGWPAAVLIFGASLVAVLLAGLVLMGFLVPG
jgi:hypothetical protein